MYDTVIVRYGEIFLKSEYVRRSFERLLEGNISRAMKRSSLSGTLYHKRHRIYIRTSGAEEMAEALKSVFGIVSLSPAVETSSQRGDIEETAIGLARQVMLPGCSFAVRVRRTGKHAYNSRDIEQALGKLILDSMESRVDLENPDKTIYVEVRDDAAYVYDRKIDGLGGLPYGSQGGLVALVSTGIDSPVASWMMMRRGCRIIALHMGDAEEVRPVVERLEFHACEKIKTYSVPLDEILGKISFEAGRYTCIICKRMIYRIAEAVMEKESAYGIITGESIGQVASQTLQNLRTIDCVSAPVYRPLIGMDKEEIIKTARRIGTYGFAKGGVCRFVPKKPATASKADVIGEIEAAAGLEDILEDVKDRFIFQKR